MAFALPLVLILILLAWYPARYETNDDFFMNLIASGFYSGSPDEHLTYSHFLPGLVVSSLFKLYAGINWYFFYLLFFHWLGWSLILYAWFRNTSNTFVIPALLVVMVLFETYFYLNFQFTTTSAILACGGMSLILTGDNWSRPLQRSNLLGLAAIVVASMIRYEPALLVSFLSAPLILLGTHWRKWPGTIILLLMLPAGIFLSEKLNKSYYSLQPEWNTFFTELKTGNKFNDNPAFYQTIINERKNLQQINGWSENDMLLFGVFFRNYAPVYNVEAYQRLYQSYNQLRAKPFRDYFYLFRHDFGKLPVLLLAVLAFALGSTRTRWIILVQFIVLGLITYYIYSFLLMKERVIYGILLCLSVNYLYLISKAPAKPQLYKIRTSLIQQTGLVLLVIVAGLLLNTQVTKLFARHKAQAEQLQKDLPLLADKNACYVIYGGCIPFEGIPPIENRFTWQKREFTMFSLSAFHKSPLNKPNLARFNQSALETAFADPRYKVITFADSAMIPLTPERLDRFSIAHLGCSLHLESDSFIANSNKRLFWFKGCEPIQTDSTSTVR